MPGISADKIIGKTLYAKKRIDKLNYNFKKIGVFNAGDSVGQVYSYITRGGNVYWLFQPTYGTKYAVKHDPTAFQISDEVRQAIEQQQQETEAEKKKQKGAVAYYIEKYGVWILGALVASVAIKEYIKK